MEQIIKGDALDLLNIYDIESNTDWIMYLTQYKLNEQEYNNFSVMRIIMCGCFVFQTNHIEQNRTIITECLSKITQIREKERLDLLFKEVINTKIIE